MCGRLLCADGRMAEDSLLVGRGVFDLCGDMVKGKKRKKKRRNKTKLTSRDYLTEEQVGWVLRFLRKDAETEGFRASVNLFLFELMIITGLRRCEVVGLELRDLPGCHGKNCIDVRWEIAKNGRARTITLSDEMVVEIGNFVGRFRDGCKPRAPVLLNEYGRRMKGWNVYARVKTIAKKTGLTWLHPHALRHTYCTLLYKVKKDQRFVQMQAGHVKLETTGIYTHIGDTEQIKQVSALDWLVTSHL